MAADKIRMGVMGANIHRGWAPRSHLPALVASPDFELTAVCTTRAESAEEAANAFDARLAFHDYREMLAHPDIDAVAVVLHRFIDTVRAASEQGRELSVPAASSCRTRFDGGS
jgi:predicted dehydrogenase